MNITKHWLSLISLFVLVFAAVIPANTKALSYSDIFQQGRGRVLGDSTQAVLYPSSTLVKDHGIIYFVRETTKITFANYRVFFGLGYSLKNVIQGDLSNYSSSPAFTISSSNIAHPWGSWLLYKGTIYYSVQQGLIGVPNQTVFNSNGGQSNLVVRANKYDLTILNNNPHLPLLVESDPRVYIHPQTAPSKNISLIPPVVTMAPPPMPAPSPTPSPVPPPSPTPSPSPTPKTPAAAASTITVISPNGGEQFSQNSNQTVTWSAPSTVASVNISISAYIGCLYATPACYIPTPAPITVATNVANSGSFSWAIGTDIPSGQYLLTISDSGNSGLSSTSAAPFNIASESSKKNFSIVVTPKIISDFNNPGPSISKFYDNYQQLMAPFGQQLIVFYVGSGDQILNYPTNPFANPTQQTQTLWAGGAPLQFDPAWTGYFNGAQAVVDTQDKVAGQNSYQINTNGPNVRQATISQLFPFGQGILIKKFPKISWSWKKDGGSTATMAFLLSNRDTGAMRWVGYYAGTRPQGADLDHWAQFNLGAVPTSWTSQQVDIEHDLISIYARVPEGAANNNEQKIVAQNWEIVGMALDPYDGNSAHFANIQASTDTNDIKWGQNSETAVNSADYLNQIGNAYPQALNYSQLKNIFAQFRAEGQRRNLNVKLFDGIEPGHEFTLQPWKFIKHPEVIINNNLFKDIDLLAPLNADSSAYAAYPQGITQGTTTADFLVNQTGKYVADMNLDGVYLTNGFGLYPEGFAWLANPTAAKSQGVLAFFKNMKAALGTKQVLWMDSYLSTQIDQKYWSMPDEAFNYIDYVEISTFFQDSSGVLVVAPWSNSANQLNDLLGTPGKTNQQHMTDTITSELALRQTHPNVKVLWTYYFFDPWYPVGFQQNTNTTTINTYKNQLDGFLVYSNDFRGNNMPQSMMTPLFSVFGR